MKRYEKNTLQPKLPINCKQKITEPVMKPRNLRVNTTGQAPGLCGSYAARHKKETISRSKRKKRNRKLTDFALLLFYESKIVSPLNDFSLKKECTHSSAAFADVAFFTH